MQDKPHIVTAFDDDLARIATRISEMGGLAEEQLASALEAEGYRVIGARNGEQALRLVETEQPALISLDIILPGLCGEAARQLFLQA